MSRYTIVENAIVRTRFDAEAYRNLSLKRKGAMTMSTDTLEKTEATEVPRTEPTRSGQRFRPAVDINEQADELTLVADMPGVSGDDIDVSFEKGELTIHGKVPPRSYEDGEMLLEEYGVGDFYRTFQVSENVDAAGITAECADGVLTLHLPKVEAIKPRKITVQGT